MATVDIPLIKLRRRPDARRLVPEAVSSIAASMRDVGVISPLRVRPKVLIEGGREAEGWEITCGSHRFEAATQCGFATVPCEIVNEDDRHAELAMIDENLRRAELGPAERASSVARRKELYLLIHPETAHGGDRKSDQVADFATRSFAEETAEATGRAARTVRQDAERGEKISDRALALVAGTHLNTGTYLDKLKKLGPSEQEARVQRELAAPRKPISPAPVPRNEFESEQAWLAKGVKWLESGSAEWRERAHDHLFPDDPIMDRRHG